MSRVFDLCSPAFAAGGQATEACCVLEDLLQHLHPILYLKKDLLTRSGAQGLHLLLKYK